MDEQIGEIGLTLCLYIGLPALFLGIGWFIGYLSESRHEKSLRKREEALKDVEVTDMRNPPGFSDSAGACTLVSGEAVIASDAFKTWVFGLKNVVGGESKTFTRLFGRARREALLRMKAQAKDLGCNAICSVRIDGADIGGNASGVRGKRGSNMAIVKASGTAWRR